MARRSRTRRGSFVMRRRSCTTTRPNNATPRWPARVPAGRAGRRRRIDSSDLESRYDASRKQIEDRKAHLRREIERLEGKRDEGGFLEFAGDVNPFARSKGETREDEIKALRRELESLEGLQHLDRRQILMIDGTPGDQRIVEVHGNLATAKKVIIHVPGINTDLGDYTDGHSNARNLYEEARAVYGDDVAVVSFADYNIPDDLGEAASTRGAESGAPQLNALVGQLHDMGHSTGDISVVAHSYGSTVTGHAMEDGLDVGRVVVLGSPGMGGNDRSALGSPSVDLWAASAPIDVTSGDQMKYAAGGAAVGGILGGLVGGPVGTAGGAALGGMIGAGDPVSWAPAHGESPAADGFGANRFDVPDAYGHSAYFDDGSASLENIARLATGRPPR